MTLNVSAGYAFIDNEVMGEIRGQTVRAKSISETLTRERVINEAETSSHSVSVPFEKKAGSSATADVSFNDGEISSVLRLSVHWDSRMSVLMMVKSAVVLRLSRTLGFPNV